MAVLHEFHGAMGALIAEHEGTRRPLRRRRHPDLLQRSAPGSAIACARAARMALAMQARFVPLRAALAQARATSSTSASASRADSRRSARSATRAASTTRRSAASSISRARLCGEAEGGRSSDRPAGARGARRFVRRGAARRADAQRLRAAGAGVPAARHRIRCGVARRTARSARGYAPLPPQEDSVLIFRRSPPRAAGRDTRRRPPRPARR